MMAEHEMREKGKEYNDSHERELCLKQGFRRFDVLCREPFFILAEEYDPQCAGEVGAFIEACVPGSGGKTVFLLDVTEDISYEKLVEPLVPLAGEFVLAAAGSEGALFAEKIGALLQDKGAVVTVCSSAEDGIKLCLAKAAVPGRPVPVAAFCSSPMADVIRGAFSRLCKKQQRKLATARRRALTQEERDAKSRIICDRLIRLLQQPEYCKVRTIFSYRGTWEEVNVDTFNDWAEAHGYRVAYPISLPHGIMKAAVPENENSWHRAAYDILEPVMEESVILEPEDIDLIIVPCVAFDAQGNRCGHGAGYYDRFMTRIAPEMLVMAAFEAQKLETVMTEKTDLPIRTVVTEEGVTGCPDVVILQFGSETCAPCAAIRKKIEEWSRDHEGVRTQYISIEEYPEAAAGYGVFGAPTVLLFVEGKLTVRESGYFSLDDVFRKAGRYMELLNPVTIRRAEPDDAGQLLKIYAHYVVNTAITFEYIVPSLEEFRGRIEKTLEKYPYLVLLENGIMKGYVYAGVFKGRAAYDRSCEVSIYLDHDVRGRGYGRKLYEALEGELKARGFLNMYACIAYPITEDEYLTKNSEHFHEHLGFRKVGEFHKCAFKFNRWYNMIWMEKFIGEHGTAGGNKHKCLDFPDI